MTSEAERTVEVEDVVWIWTEPGSRKSGYPFRVTSISSYTDDGRMYVYGDALTGTGQQVDHLFLLISRQQPLAVPITRVVATASVPRESPNEPTVMGHGWPVDPPALRPYMQAAASHLRDRHAKTADAAQTNH